MLRCWSAYSWPVVSLPPSPCSSPGTFSAAESHRNRRFQGISRGESAQFVGMWWMDGMRCHLFNLGFVYAYPQSPYRDLQKARQYLRELHSRFPQSPWTSQGQVLLAFMNEQVGLEEAQRRLRSGLRTRDAAIQKATGTAQSFAGDRYRNRRRSASSYAGLHGPENEFS